MSTPKKFLNVFVAVLMIMAAVYITVIPASGFYVVLLIISIGLIVRGVGSFVYYGTLAKYMVGGKKELFMGLIFIDIGLYMMSKVTLPADIVMSYLLILFGISGAINLIRAVELKKAGAGVWKLKLFIALLQFALIIAGNIFSHYSDAVAWVYGVYLVVKAGERIYRSIRNTAMVYIS